MEHNEPKPQKLNRRRFDAVIAHQGRSLSRFAAALGRWTPQHIAHVAAGDRQGSAALYAAIRQALGEPAWLWVTGQTDSLRDEGASDAA